MSLDSSEGRIYELVIKQSARKELARCERSVQHRIRDAINALKTDPMPHGAKKTVRCGRCLKDPRRQLSQLYTFAGGELVIVVIKIGHRSSVYRR